MVTFLDMLPVLLTLGKFSISSYGVFLVIGFLFGVFLVWRLSRAWDMDEEKTLDLVFLTILGGLLGARLIFVLTHLPVFSGTPLNIILINKMPGFSFPGGILGGVLAFYYFSKRLKLDFWQIADIALVGFLGGMIFADLGCFLGGCSVGIPSKSFLAVSMVGVVGRRWPVQLLESISFAFVLWRVWIYATRFHQRGKIVGLSLVYIGLLKFLLDFLREEQEQVLWLAFTALGFSIYYRVTKQNPVLQIKKYIKTFTLQNLLKTCYNQKTLFYWRLKNTKKFFRRINVKFTRENR